METIILLVHLLTALAIIGLIMLQQGKGADMGASFGAGASQTLFGSAGSGNFFSRMTAVFATVFFITSFSLAVLAKQKTDVTDDLALPELEEVEVPFTEAQSPAADVPSIDEGVQGAVESAQADVPSLEDTADAAVEAINDAVQNGDIPPAPTE